MLALLKELRSIIFAKSPIDKKLFKNKVILPWNIYQRNKAETAGENAKRYQWLHYVIKYRVFVPLLLILHTMIGKYLVKDIPETAYNEDIILFDKAAEESLKIWFKRHILNTIKNYDLSEDELEKEFKKERAVKLVRKLKDMYYTLILNDTSYRDLHHIFMFILSKFVSEKYGGKGPKTYPLYVSTSILDFRFLTVDEIILENQKLRKNFEGK